MGCPSPVQRLLCLLPLLLLGACRNPFAPRLGDPRSVWNDQATVGGLLENFRMAYIRQDSLRYAECISCDTYTFNYFDTDLAEYASMPRELDLATTGRLFRHYEDVDLRWVGISESLSALETADSLISFTVFFVLTLDATWLDGHARFSVIRQGGQNAACPSPIFGDDPVFRIVQWDDNL
ncbi:MAG: hypothetical protein H6678_15560 [Candidatus Delongbacteria bacterium]|nr:hypothetical protein [Candidatus Delongbacteria bacterium]